MRNSLLLQPRHLPDDDASYLLLMGQKHSHQKQQRAWSIFFKQSQHALSRFSRKQNLHQSHDAAPARGQLFGLDKHFAIFHTTSARDALSGSRRRPDLSNNAGG
ncbi:hypothetical protein ElyMa_005008600 [Elysia marginata]|uniref:Uncharacterized protein n=1 Tax=Elysia marginata TaxID=1093978 RepID=A0AAV4J6W4_9GAST|nr:hypothetical protein ElyMa_005008600 [Elysia marginata]